MITKKIIIGELRDVIRNSVPCPMIISTPPGHGVIYTLCAEYGSLSYLNMTVIDHIDFDIHMKQHIEGKIILDEIHLINPSIKDHLIHFLSNAYFRQPIAICSDIQKVPQDILTCFKFHIKIDK
jgi:hypothetical protein